MASGSENTSDAETLSGRTSWRCWESGATGQHWNPVRLEGPPEGGSHQEKCTMAEDEVLQGVPSLQSSQAVGATVIPFPLCKADGILSPKTGLLLLPLNHTAAAMDAVRCTSGPSQQGSSYRLLLFCSIVLEFSPSPASLSR